MTNEHVTALTELKRQHQAELAELRSARNSDPYLTAEGKANQERQDQQRLAAKYSAQLESLTARMRSDTGLAMTTAAKVVSAATAPSTDALRAEWERVTMLLDAGAGINTIVRGADQARLHAIQQYGPTWLEAQALKTRPSGLSDYDKPADLMAFNTQMRDRWAEVLPNGDRIVAGAEAAGVAAGYDVTAKAFSNSLNGVNTGTVGIHDAMESHYAEQTAAANFNPTTAGE